MEVICAQSVAVITKEAHEYIHATLRNVVVRTDDITEIMTCYKTFFRDVLRITHPKPKTEEIDILFKKILNGQLKVPYTWEIELSKRGNKKEVWDELISSGKVGYMALLRNLRNIVKCGADLKPVLDQLSDPERVRKSRRLPFIFYSAYHTLSRE